MSRSQVSMRNQSRGTRSDQLANGIGGSAQARPAGECYPVLQYGTKVTALARPTRSSHLADTRRNLNHGLDDTFV